MKEMNAVMPDLYWQQVHAFVPIAFVFMHRRKNGEIPFDIPPITPGFIDEQFHLYYEYLIFCLHRRAKLHLG